MRGQEASRRSKIFWLILLVIDFLEFNCSVVVAFVRHSETCSSLRLHSGMEEHTISDLQYQLDPFYFIKKVKQTTKK